VLTDAGSIPAVSTKQQTNVSQYKL